MSVNRLSSTKYRFLMHYLCECLPQSIQPVYTNLARRYDMVMYRFGHRSSTHRVVDENDVRVARSAKAVWVLKYKRRIRSVLSDVSHGYSYAYYWQAQRERQVLHKNFDLVYLKKNVFYIGLLRTTSCRKKHWTKIRLMTADWLLICNTPRVVVFSWFAPG